MEAVVAIGTYVLGAIGTTAAVSTAVAFTVGVATIVAGSMALNKLMMSLYEPPKMDTDEARQRTVKGTIEPQKIVYGEALVSGVVSFLGVSGTDNKDMYHSIVLAGHEVEAITDIYFDNEVIENSQINSGNAAGGNVTAGTFAPQNGTTICKINKHLGASGQTVDSDLDSAFATITTAHKGVGLAYIVTKWVLTSESDEIWSKYQPSDIKALVKGRKIYDSRTTTTGYSDNPALCLVDYLTNTDFGMGISTDKIDYNSVNAAANICDELVNVPGGTQKRFTCNGVLFGTDTHKANINKIMSSMNGMLTYTNGKFIIRAGAYEAPTVTLNENHLRGGISVKTSVERSDRFNTITGVFIDPDQNHKSSEFPEVQLAEALARDNGEVLSKEFQFPMTNNVYMAQRIAFKLLKQTSLQTVVTFPANLAAVQVSVGDRVNLNIEELGWVNKVFVCLGWNFSDSGNGGVNLTLREDNSDAYADPIVDDYNAPTATTTLESTFAYVARPLSLSATSEINSVILEWDNPESMENILYIEIFSSDDATWANAQLIGTTVGTQFIHGSSNKVDPVLPGDTRYYFIRARAFSTGESLQAVSVRFPNTDSSTIVATVGEVPSTSLSVTVSNISKTAFGYGSSGTVTSNSASTTVSGGTSPYTYSWSHISTTQGNTPTISNSTVDNPTFSATVIQDNQSISTWQLTVTDNVSATASTYVTVTLTWVNIN